jgi:tetratricopeptide (TPR) repeat protein
MALTGESGEVNMLDTVEHLIKMKRYQEAITLCQDELSRKPDEPRVLYLLAVAHYKREEYSEAIRALEQIIEADPDRIDALLFLAHISSWGYGAGYPKATDLYRRVLALNNKEINAYIGLALMRRSPGIQITVEESIELLEQALAIDPSRPEVHNNLAYSYWEAGEYQKAKEHFEKLLGMSDPETQSIIRKELLEIGMHQRPQNLVYLGPSLPLID